MSELRVSLNPGWINEFSDELLDDNFKKIFIFYVINLPNNSTSYRSLDITKYWDSKVWKEKILRKKLLESANLVENETYIKASLLEDVSNAIARAKINKFDYKSDKNVIVFYKGKWQEFISIFYYIRCALAHGRFMIKMVNGHKMYYLETGTKKEDKLNVKARMILREETLLKWIEIIKNGKSEN